MHKKLIEAARPDITAHELWKVMNGFIVSLGFENLDFKGNLGHSIVSELQARQYIEKDNGIPLGQWDLFTFEPHIRKPNTTLGFKHENIYRFNHGKLQPL